MELKGIVDIDAGQNDKNIGLKKGYTQFKGYKGQKKSPTCITRSGFSQRKELAS